MIASRGESTRTGKLCALATAILLAGWLCSGFYTVGANERGVVTAFGKRWVTVGPGIHYALPAPVCRVYTPSVTDVRRLEVGFRQRGELWNEHRRSDMLTGDMNILKLMMAVQYRIRDPEQYLFGAEEPDWLVVAAVESTLASLVANLAVDDVLTTAKTEIESRSIQDAQALLDRYDCGLTLLGGNLQVVSPPIHVIEAFNDVARANKDAERAQDDARVYENEVIPDARGEAQEIVAAAHGQLELRVNQARGEAQGFADILREYRQSPAITRTRLYLECIERVLAKATVLVVDEDAGVTVYGR